MECIQRGIDSDFSRKAQSWIFYVLVLLVLLITGAAGRVNSLIRRRADNGERSTDADRFEDREVIVDENQELKN